MSNKIRGKKFDPNLRITIDGALSIKKSEFAEELKKFLEEHFGFKRVEISPSSDYVKENKRTSPFYEEGKISDEALKGVLSSESVGIFVHYDPIIPVEKSKI